MLSLLLACSAGPENVAVEVSEAVGTVVLVHWQTEEVTTGYVEYGLTADYGLQTPITASGTEHTAQLLGLRSNETYHLRVVADGAVSEGLTVTTDPLPSGLPSLALQGDPDAMPGFIPLPLIGSQGAVVIVDGEGEIVWYHLIEGNSKGPRRVQLHPDGTGLYVNDIGYEAEASISWSDWTGTDVSITSVYSHNHDFALESDGSLVLMVHDAQYFEEQPYRGDALMRLHPDGTEEMLWSAWDHFTPADVPSGEKTDSWTHANALDLDEERGVFHLGMRNPSTILTIDAQTGALMSGLGEHPFLSDFSFTEGTVPFNHQHQFEFVSDERLLVFDNRPDTEAPTRVVEYAIDEDTQTIDEVWSYGHQPALDVYALGDVHRMDDGNTFIVWSTAGELQVVSPEGEVLWQLNAELGAAFGYATPVESLYR